MLLFLLTVNAYIKTSVRDRIVSPDNIPMMDTDCILVLGAGVWAGGRPSFMLEDRLLQAIELYNAGVSDRLLMSGDHGRKDYDEVNVMKRFAVDRGVPSSHVLWIMRVFQHMRVCIAPGMFLRSERLSL